MIRRASTFLIGAALMSIVATSVAHAFAAGDLDDTFGNRGIVISDIDTGDDVGQAVAIQTDGKIVVAGSAYVNGNQDIALLRYRTDGTLDTDFSGDGIVTTPVGSRSDQGQAVAIQPDGKIVVVGFALIGNDNDFAVLRYRTDGTLDTDFSGDGILTIDFASDEDYAWAVAIQTDGDIVIGGRAFLNNINQDQFALARVTTTGDLDNDFGTAGRFKVSMSSTFAGIGAIAIQPDESIVAAGYAYNGTNYDVALVRTNSVGVLDTNFDTDGKLMTSVGSNSTFGRAMTIQSDGKILVVGYQEFGNTTNGLIFRYSSSGALDNTFDDDGMVRVIVDAGSSITNALGLQADGKIVVGGMVDTGSGIDVLLARYTSNGSIDSDFGSGGKVITTVSARTDIGFAIALQSDGRIVVAGHSYSGTNENLMVLRYSGVSSLTESGSPVTSPSEIVGPPNSSSYITGNKKVTVRWSGVIGAASYVVTNSAGATQCTPTTTSCVVSNLRNGKAYMYRIFAVNADGVKSTSGTEVRVVPGFTLKKTSFIVKKSVKLSSIVTTPSKGKKTWQVTSGSCRLSGSKIVMPKKSGSCKVKLSVAKNKSYPKMSTTVRVAVTK